MIRVTLNLARRPAENFRRVWILWGGSLAVVAAVTLVLAIVALTGWLRTRPVQQRVSAIRSQIAPLAAEQATWDTELTKPESRAAFAQSDFFNELLDRRSISWTLLFERLEAILPDQVELVSLKPVERRGGAAIDLVLATNELPSAIDFVGAIESSGDFTQARVEHVAYQPHPPAARGQENLAEEKKPTYQVELTASYQPREGNGFYKTGGGK